eukprot:Awhi_evm1s1707
MALVGSWLTPRSSFVTWAAPTTNSGVLASTSNSPLQIPVQGPNWVGTNSILLWACDTSVQRQILSQLVASNVKVVRIFFVGTDQAATRAPNTKIGCGSIENGAPEYESVTVGVYNPL